MHAQTHARDFVYLFLSKYHWLWLFSRWFYAVLSFYSCRNVNQRKKIYTSFFQMIYRIEHVCAWALAFIYFFLKLNLFVLHSFPFHFYRSSLFTFNFFSHIRKKWNKSVYFILLVHNIQSWTYLCVWTRRMHWLQMVFLSSQSFIHSFLGCWLAGWFSLFSRFIQNFTFCHKREHTHELTRSRACAW